MLNFGLIGLGKMGLSHLAIVNAHPDIRLAGVCDDAGYVRSILTKYTDLKVYSDYRALLNDANLDAVVIATPSRFHGEMARAALNRNLHVFCEKPFCLDISDGAELVDLAACKRLVTQVGYHNRFLGTFKEAKRLIDANVLGRIHHVRAEAYGPVVLRPKGATWRTSRTEGGGCLYDYASHAIDIVNFLVGAPERVAGAVLNKVFSRDVEDEVYATLYFEKGMTGQIAANWSDGSCRRMSTKVTIWASNGKMIADREELKLFVVDPSGLPMSTTQGWNVRYTTELSSGVNYYLRGEEYSSQIDYFVRCIVEGREENISSFASALQTDRVVGMMLQSGNEERRASQRTVAGLARSTARKLAGRLKSAAT